MKKISHRRWCLPHGASFNECRMTDGPVVKRYNFRGVRGIPPAEEGRNGNNQGGNPNGGDHLHSVAQRSSLQIRYSLCHTPIAVQTDGTQTENTGSAQENIQGQPVKFENMRLEQLYIGTKKNQEASKRSVQDRYLRWRTLPVFNNEKCAN